MATTTMNQDHAVFIGADDDRFLEDISPDNALMDLMPPDLQATMPPARKPKSEQQATVQPASDAATNQPATTDTSIAAAQATANAAAVDGTKPAEGQPPQSGITIEIAGEQTPVVTTQPQQTGNGTTVSTEDDRDVIEIAPGKRLRTPTGQIIASDEVINQEALRPRYDKTLAERNKLEKEYGELKSRFDLEHPFVEAAQRDEILTNAVNAVRNGATPKDAIRGAIIQAGKEQEFSEAFQSAPAGPPKPGTEGYYRETDLAKLGIEEGSPEHAEWWKGHVAQNAKDEANARIAEWEKRNAERESARQATQERTTQTQQEETRKREIIRGENEKELGKLPQLVKEELGLDINQLPRDQVDRLADAITRSAGRLPQPLNLADTAWMEQHVVRENDLRLAITKAGIRVVPANGVAANNTATNGHAAPAAPKEPLLPTPSVQSRVTLDPNRPLQPGPESQGALPFGGNRPLSDERGYLGALHDILPKD